MGTPAKRKLSGLKPSSSDNSWDLQTCYPTFLAWLGSTWLDREWNAGRYSIILVRGGCCWLQLEVFLQLGLFWGDGNSKITARITNMGYTGYMMICKCTHLVQCKRDLLPSPRRLSALSTKTAVKTQELQRTDNNLRD